MPPLTNSIVTGAPVAALNAASTAGRCSLHLLPCASFGTENNHVSPRLPTNEPAEYSARTSGLTWLLTVCSQASGTEIDGSDDVAAGCTVEPSDDPSEPAS